MATWNPSQIRDEAGLKLSNSEIETIQQKLPKTPDGFYYADAVFEGGGVKGTAFLGALRCFSEVGIEWRKVAGTSAGAITAALVAADFEMDELERIIGELDYMKDLLKRKSSRFILNGNPDDDLQNPQWMIPNLLLTGKLGQYSSEPFKQWLEQVLGDRLRSFKDIFSKEGRALKVVVSDISRGEMMVLPDDLSKDEFQEKVVDDPLEFAIAEAVRLSMSIPFFFEPGKLGESTIVDGGILSNFPLWIYDVNPQVGKRNRVPRWPTFGFRLSESKGFQKINSPMGVFSGMLQTMMVAKDRYHLRKSGQGRVVTIDTTGVTATEFNLGNEEKDFLYRQGYETTRQFLLKDWNWQQHLLSRGYDAEEIAAANAPITASAESNVGAIA